MAWVIGALIVVLGIAIIISGVTGTAGQLYTAVTGRGADTDKAMGDLEGALAYPHAPAVDVFGNQLDPP